MSRELVGRLLVATPVLVDSNFARSVVLVLAHLPEGSLGLVLNRPGGLGLGEVLESWTHLAAEPKAVFVGGPVGSDTAICLGLDGTSWRTVDVDQLPSEAQVERMRLFAGYAGWSAGQLQAEIDADGWFVITATAADVFTAAPAELWRSVLRRQGGRLAIASTAPVDPRAN